MVGFSRRRRLFVALSSALLVTSGGCGTDSGLGGPGPDLMALPDLASPPEMADLADLANSLDLADLAPAGELRLLAGALGGAGSVDGTRGAARFNSPQGIASDGAGNLYVADSYSHTIRKIVIATGAVTTLAGTAGIQGIRDGVGAAATFYLPEGIASDGAGHLFIADTGNDRIRRVVIATGAVTTLAGDSHGSADGTGAAAAFSAPSGIASDGAGNLYIADTRNHTIRKTVIATGAVTTIAGTAGVQGSADGTGAAATFNRPQGIAGDGAGNLYVADYGNNTIRKLVIATGAVTTLAGTAGMRGFDDGTGAAARLDHPQGLLSDGSGSLYVADTENSTIRRIVIATGAVTTIAGTANNTDITDGTGAAARFYYPAGIARDGAGNLYVADEGSSIIRRIAIASSAVTTVAGTGVMQGTSDGTAGAARFRFPRGVASDGAGNLYVTDTYNNAIRRVEIATGAVTTLVDGSTGPFQNPYNLASDRAGNLYVTDYSDDTIRKVVIATGAVTTLAGAAGMEGSTDGTGAAARFCSPTGIANDGAGNLYVADYCNDTIRRIVIATGAVTTLAGTAGVTGSDDGMGAAASFDGPRGIVSDGAGNLYVVDANNKTIRKIVVATGAVTTLAGTAAEQGSTDGTGAAARFEYPTGIASDGEGNLYVTDPFANTVRKIVIATGAVTTVVGVAGHGIVQPGPLPASLSQPVGIAVLGKDLAIIDNAENAVLLAHFN